MLTASSVAAKKLNETKKFMETKQGTSLQEIFECVEFLRKEGKVLAGGRNFSVVYDPWRIRTRPQLLKELRSNSDMYKLRRHNNNFMQMETKKV